MKHLDHAQVAEYVRDVIVATFRHAAGYQDHLGRAQRPPQNAVQFCPVIRGVGALDRARAMEPQRCGQGMRVGPVYFMLARAAFAVR